MKSQALLKAMMDKSKLVLVERVRHDKTGDHITKKWVSASEVKSTDAVIENPHLLDKDHPALKNKPKHAATKAGINAAKKFSKWESGKKKAASAVKKKAKDAQGKPEAGKTAKPQAPKPDKAKAQKPSQTAQKAQKTTSPAKTDKSSPETKKAAESKNTAKQKPSKEKLAKLQAIMSPKEFETYLSHKGMTVAEAQGVIAGKAQQAAVQKDEAKPDAASNTVTTAQLNKWHKNLGSAEKLKAYVAKHKFDLTALQKEYLDSLESKEASAKEPEPKKAVDEIPNGEVDLATMKKLLAAQPAADVASYVDGAILTTGAKNMLNEALDKEKQQQETSDKEKPGIQTAGEKPEPKKPTAKKDTAQDKKNTYAEPRPVNRGDMKKLGDSIGKEEGPDLSKAQIKNILESVRSEANAQQLDAGIASSDNEKAYVQLLNGIQDKATLKKIAYTGIIPEDADATEFMDKKMFTHYYSIIETPDPPYSKEEIKTKLAGSIGGYFVDSANIKVAGALQKTGMHTGSYVFRMAFPSESTMILGSTSNGNRQVTAKTDSMPFFETDNTSPSNLFAIGKHFAAGGKSEADGMRALIDHVAKQEPSLAEECKEWKNDFNAVMEACGEDLDKMGKALNNTYDNVKDLFTKEQYNAIVGGALKLYGSSLTDGGGTAFEGDFTTLTAGDCIRMSYASTGTMERQAVISNVMNAYFTAQFTTGVYDSKSSTFSQSPKTKAAAAHNLEGIGTISLEQFRATQQYVSNTNDMPSAKEGNPHYTQSLRAQVGNRDLGKDLFDTDDPSPVVDMFRGVIESAISYANNQPASKPKGKQYTASMLKPVTPVLASPDFGDDELLGLRAMAFQNAACSIKSVTGQAYKDIKEEVEYKEEGYAKWKKNGGKGPKGSNHFPEREIVMRGAYQINNSKANEKFEARLAQDKAKGGGQKYTDPMYHGTGFGAGAAILHDGGFRTKGVKQASGSTLGAGVYFGKSTGKVVPYAATGGCYSAEWQELMYDGTNDYSYNDISDGVIFKMEVSKGMKTGTSASVGGANAKNRNSGGDCDVVECTGYKTWEAVAADSDLVNPKVMIDVGERFNGNNAAFNYIHNKNKGHLGNGPHYPSKTNNNNGDSILDAYLEKLSSRAR